MIVLKRRCLPVDSGYSRVSEELKLVSRDVRDGDDENHEAGYTVPVGLREESLPYIDSIKYSADGEDL